MPYGTSLSCRILRHSLCNAPVSNDQRPSTPAVIRIQRCNLAIGQGEETNTQRGYVALSLQSHIAKYPQDPCVTILPLYEKGLASSRNARYPQPRLGCLSTLGKRHTSLQNKRFVLLPCNLHVVVFQRLQAAVGRLHLLAKNIQPRLRAIDALKHRSLLVYLLFHLCKPIIDQLVGYHDPAKRAG